MSGVNQWKAQVYSVFHAQARFNRSKCFPLQSENMSRSLWPAQLRQVGFAAAAAKRTGSSIARSHAQPVGEWRTNETNERTNR